jgi:hypothetical protein
MGKVDAGFGGSLDKPGWRHRLRLRTGTAGENQWKSGKVEKWKKWKK